MLQSDHLIDLGPGAGEKGGEIVFNGKTNNIKKISSITSDYLFNKQEISRSSFFKLRVMESLFYRDVQEIILKM